MTGLEILEAFATEIDQVVLERKKVMRIKCLILEQIPQKFIELFEILLTNPADPPLLDKTLNTLRAWTTLKLQILQYETKNCAEILCDAFKACRSSGVHKSHEC